VDVSIAVDGSASNDGSHLLDEARQAMLLSRLRAGIKGASRSGGADQPIMSARQTLELATRGGAAVLGRKDIGSLEPGKAADFIAIDLEKIDYAGAIHDLVAATVFCAPVKVDYNVVGGKFVVKEGQLTSFELPALIEEHNQAAARLLKG